jgi:uncharacterized membrane protein
MCDKELAKTRLAKQKHAEFMIKMAEKIGGLSFTGLLGAPVMYWFTPQGQQNHKAFLAFILITAVGAYVTYHLLKNAMDIFNQEKNDAQ